MPIFWRKTFRARSASLLTAEAPQSYGGGILPGLGINPIVDRSSCGYVHHELSELIRVCRSGLA